MSEVSRILDQLKRVFAGPAWHGPSVTEILEETTFKQAAARPLTGAHNIWELVLHISAWERAIVRRLQGDRAQLVDEENWPAVEAMTDEAWQRTRQTLRLGHEELSAAIAGLKDEQLDQPIIEGMASVYVTLHGIIQHDLYHAGQIALLKKATSEASTNE
jgi:uncharacterized damage-inducible protein DinB